MSELTAEQQEQVEQLFERALAVAAEQRPALLDSTCSDPAVRDEVESLLAARPAADRLMNEPIADSGLLADALLQAEATQPLEEDPDQIGPYRVAQRRKRLTHLGRRSILERKKVRGL